MTDLALSASRLSSDQGRDPHAMVPDWPGGGAQVEGRIDWTDPRAQVSKDTTVYPFGTSIDSKEP